MQQRSLSVDNATLAVRVFEPAGEVRASVVIGGAMGVPQSYYAAYATWLAQEGYRVWTFDYRGHGDSLALVPGGRLRGFKADLLDWARDYEAVVKSALNERPQLALYLLGHSLGAQLPGLFERPERVDGLFSLGAGIGYWRENAPALRRRVLFLWYFVAPLATLLCGYFPGRRLGMVGDLPAGVIRQWRRWCLHPRYVVSEGQEVERLYAAVPYPIRAWSFSDDEMMALEATRSLLALYASAPHALEVIRPSEVGLPRIGHLGFFRDSMRKALWPRSARVLQSFAEGNHAGESRF
jgi:predicted alpha/beta hydrolase